MKRFPIMCAAAVLTLAACQQNAGNSEAGNSADINADMANSGVAMDNASGTAAGVDTAFVTDAMKGDNGEVEIGKLAASKGMSQGTKDFGNLLVTDHGAHKTKLAALGSSAGVPATDEPSDEAKATLEKLNKLSGAEFDKAFKTAMIEDHQKDIAKYEKQASNGDAQTAALAKETLPTLRKHLAAAQAL